MRVFNRFDHLYAIFKNRSPEATWQREEDLAGCKETVREYLRDRERTEPRFFICRKLPQLVTGWHRKGVDEVHMEGFFQRLEYEEHGPTCANLVREELERVKVSRVDKFYLMR